MLENRAFLIAQVEQLLKTECADDWEVCTDAEEIVDRMLTTLTTLHAGVGVNFADLAKMTAHDLAKEEVAAIDGKELR